MEAAGPQAPLCPDSNVTWAVMKQRNVWVTVTEREGQFWMTGRNLAQRRQQYKGKWGRMSQAEGTGEVKA